ncbi:MAG: rubredoxin [Clostridium sp.]
MKKYICDICGYIYDPLLGDIESNISPNTDFENIPDSWLCPICYIGKDVFSEID